MTSGQIKPAARAEAGVKSEGGELASAFQTGSVLLVPAEKGSAPHIVRAVWKSGGSCWIPAGQYRVKHYSIEAEHQGETWILSASGPNGPVLDIREGEKTALTLDGKVKINSGAKAKGEAVRVNACPGRDRLSAVIIKGKALIEWKACVDGGDPVSMRYG